MTALFAWPVIVILLGGVGTLALISYLLPYREKPGAKWFIVTLVGQAIFCFSYGIGLTIFDPDIRLWFEILAFIGLSWLGVPFLAFALGYTGRGTILRSTGFKILLAFPVMSTILLPLNPWHQLFWSDFTIDPVFGVATASYSFELIAFAGVLGAGTVVGIATVILLDTVLSYGPLYRKEALAVALSPIPPIVGMFPWLFGLGPAPQLNTVALGTLPHVLLDAYAFVGSGMFEFYPATNRAAERSAIDDLRTPVVVVEEQGRIVDLNEPAETTFELDPERIVTKPVSSLLDGKLPVDDLSDPDANRRFSIRHDGRKLEFRMEPSPLTDSSGNHVGYTLLFQDITDAVRREERLAVLNRVLRHNLRNDLSVVISHIEHAKATSEESDVSEPLESALATVNDLVDAGEMAREIEKTIDADAGVQTTFDLDGFLEELASECERTHPGASVSVDCDVTEVTLDKDVLDSVLGELLDNAVIHNGDEAAIDLRGTRSDGDLEIAINDDGPGIPEHEIETLLGGEETALEHGSGLGLWLAKWGTMQLGGDLAFELHDGGTRATVTLPTDASAD